MPSCLKKFGIQKDAMSPCLFFLFLFLLPCLFERAIKHTDGENRQKTIGVSLRSCQVLVIVNQIRLVTCICKESSFFQKVLDSCQIIRQKKLGNISFKLLGNLFNYCEGLFFKIIGQHLNHYFFLENCQTTLSIVVEVFLQNYWQFFELLFRSFHKKNSRQHLD